MKIIALDVFEEKLSCLVDSLRQIYPEDEIISFTDPFFAAQYGTRQKVDMLFTEICMGGIDGTIVASMIRRKNHNAGIVFLADTGKYRKKAFGDVKDAAYLVRPVTADAIKSEIFQGDAVR